ncbi:MAG: UvrD-helicase domain-containing protein, partial [Chloroflexota bacterium]
MTLYPELNNQQRAAVTADDGPTLVLAGPGSGKTRVLTYRIAHLINQRKIPAYAIIAVTFTNKAAGEMKERIIRLIGKDAIRGLRIGTFHALCARLLRREASEGNLEPYNSNYLIYDTDDQKSVVKRVVEELGVDLKRLRLTPYKALTMISDAKNELVAPSQYPRTEYLDEVIARIYERYQEILKESNAMDFDDLIMNTVLLLRNNVEVRNRYQKYYEYVLVDEFQDTNMAQYELVRLWCAPQNNIFVVGDEDQAIYGFRGADYRNVMRFREDYKSATTLLLEQNYRSTQTVLDAARAVIDQNRDRTPKALFTDRTDDAKIYAYEAYDEREEADFIVKEIMRLRASGRSLKDIAIMYRTNV